MKRVIGLIKVKAPIDPSSLDFEVVYLGGNDHSFHAVIAAPMLAAVDQLSIDTGAGKDRMHGIQNALALYGRVLAQGDKTCDGLAHDWKKDA